MRILYLSSEVAPFAKTGGLADVAGSLPRALAALGHDVKVAMPLYRSVKEGGWNFKSEGETLFSLGGRNLRFGIQSLRLPDSTTQYVFLQNDDFFGRPQLYQEQGRDYPDNLERFGSFSRAVLDIPAAFDWEPELIHANDWQTAMVFPYLSGATVSIKSSTPKRRPGSVFTIHNLGYQGIFPASEFGRLGLPADYFSSAALEYYGKVNLLKAGLVFADIINTVSPTYSREIQTPEFGFGLEGILQARGPDLFGIVNGVEYRHWDPAVDELIPHHYTIRNLKGKSLCKEALRKELNWPSVDGPLIGMIARLTTQKGVDLVLEVLEELVRLDLQILILGTGEPEMEARLRREARRFPAKLSIQLAFDEAFAHRIQASADILLMPSRYEPCGLNQLYALRYGTIPVVRKTGGLQDTVVDAIPSNIATWKATGFHFESISGHELLTTLRLVLELYKDAPLWEGLMKNAMAADFSWGHSARDYVGLYGRALAKARPPF